MSFPAYRTGILAGQPCIASAETATCVASPAATSEWLVHSVQRFTNATTTSPSLAQSAGEYVFTVTLALAPQAWRSGPPAARHTQGPADQQACEKLGLTRCPEARLWAAPQLTIYRQLYHCCSTRAARGVVASARTRAPDDFVVTEVPFTDRNVSVSTENYPKGIAAELDHNMRWTARRAPQRA
jgi:hypothetical protein